MPWRKAEKNTEDNKEVAEDEETDTEGGAEETNSEEEGEGIDWEWETDYSDPDWEYDVDPKYDGLMKSVPCRWLRAQRCRTPEGWVRSYKKKKVPKVKPQNLPKEVEECLFDFSPK